MQFLKYKNIIFGLLKKIKVEYRRLAILVCLILLFFVSAFIWKALASQPTNIKAEYKYAYSENGGWLNFGSNEGGMMVADSTLTGYVWSENLGWISLNCANNNSCATSNYKVVNDNEGDLSGYAWGENIGWINFAPSNGGVHINSAGEFSGYAWGENIGWIIFSCQDVDSCSISDFGVKTTWLPLSVRNKNEYNQEGVSISDVHYSSTDTSVVINWDTSHSADGHIRWGKNKNLEEEKNSNDKEKKHHIVLRNLDSDMRYYFRIKSTDENGNSDSSKIYVVSTKPTSTIFVKRKYESFSKNTGIENANNYEKVQIGVADKRENEIKNDNEVSKEMKALKPKSAEAPKKDATFKDMSTIKNLSAFYDSLSLGREKVSDFFLDVYYFTLGKQRAIVGFFAWTGEKFTNAYDSAVSKFSKEKASQVAKINGIKFFTTQVFSKNETKMLAEVRFQILDKSDKPIPNLDTMLFSDPQASVTDENGVTAFKDVPIGSHTLAFDYQGENFQKKVAIADTLTDDGNVRAEVVQVKAEKEKIASWMWLIIVLLIFAVASTVYFAWKYYQLKDKNII